MTQQEAINLFFEKLHKTVYESTEVFNAMRTLEELGIKVDSVSIVADVTIKREVAAPAPSDLQEVVDRHDAEFLRKLRIMPDIEVRE